MPSTPFVVVHSREAQESVKEWRARFGSDRRSVITIGNFDGVHCGHRKLLRGVVESARGTGAISVALTFDPHPLRIVRPEAAPVMLQTLSQRLACIADCGIDAVLVLPFTHDTAALSPEEFVRTILVETLRASAVHVGETFRFGHKQTGDVRVLRELGRALGFEVQCVPPVRVHGKIVSSTTIRAALAAGKVSSAAHLLGRPYSLAGEIRTGTGTGRKFVFPTLNLAPEPQLLPAHGVYATETVLGERIFRSATNIGVRPTFDGAHVTIESHLFDFSEELTSGKMEVRFWKRIRGEQRFSGPEALREQIQRDIARIRRFFAHLDAARLSVRTELPSTLSRGVR